MQPYRNVPTNQFLSVYWNFQQCSCETCLSRDQGAGSSLTRSQAPGSSFTIESLLSRKDERKLSIEQCGVASLTTALVPSCSSSAAPGKFTNVGIGSELIQGHSSHSYLSASHFRRPPSFGLEQASLFGRENVQTNGEFTFDEILKVENYVLLWSYWKEPIAREVDLIKPSTPLENRSNSQLELTLIA